MNRIALVEDHERLSALIAAALGNAGIAVDSFVRMEPAWHALRDMPYAALVVDRGLPDGDGLALVRRLRSAGMVTPCLIVTARDALHDRLAGLDDGADDYLVKPFPMEELVARVRALMRRPAALQSLSPRLGDLLIRSDKACMECGDELVTLAPAEVQIMLGLAHACGQTVRRASLEAAAWGLTEAVTPNALDVALHRLRKKLQAIGSKAQIVNARGHGYALREPTDDA